MVQAPHHLRRKYGCVQSVRTYRGILKVARLIRVGESKRRSRLRSRRLSVVVRAVWCDSGAADAPFASHIKVSTSTVNSHRKQQRGRANRDLRPVDGGGPNGASSALPFPGSFTVLAAELRATALRSGQLRGCRSKKGQNHESRDAWELTQSLPWQKTPELPQWRQRPWRRRACWLPTESSMHTWSLKSSTHDQTESNFDRGSTHTRRKKSLKKSSRERE